MLKFLFNAALRMLVMAALVYGTFFVPIGDHTLYRHAVRIGSTAPAQELWSAVVDAGARAKERFTAALASRAVAQPGAPAND